jgi:hypothetical protein
MRGYMAIPLPYASALGEAGLRVAAMGESTARFCACQGSPCNAPTGLNETINLYGQPTRFGLGRRRSGWFAFVQLRGALRRRSFGLVRPGSGSFVSPAVSPAGAFGRGRTFNPCPGCNGLVRSVCDPSEEPGRRNLGFFSSDRPRPLTPFRHSPDIGANCRRQLRCGSKVELGTLASPQHHPLRPWHRRTPNGEEPLRSSPSWDPLPR